MSGDADIYDAVMAGSGANRQTAAIGVGAQVSNPLGHQLLGRRGEFVSHANRTAWDLFGKPILPVPGITPRIGGITDSRVA